MPFDLQTLYNLLPAFYRNRDAELSPPGADGPLKELLSLLAESTAVLEEDLAQLYDDQFIETSAEWAVPYIGDLIGYRRLDTLSQADLPAEVRRSLSERSQVANTLGYRRRKGTLSVVEDLAQDVTGWRAKAVEFFQRMAVTQHVNHVRRHCTTVDIRQLAARGGIDSPFDGSAHTAELRPVTSGEGRYNLPNIGIFLWRLQIFPVVEQPAWVDHHHVQYLRFSPSGADLCLYTAPQAESQVTHLAGPENVPMAITRRRLHDDLKRAEKDRIIYGVQGGLQLFAAGRSIPAAEVIAADLSNRPDERRWAHEPADRYALDPETGRITIPANNPGPISVSYNFAAPSPIGTVLAESALPDPPPGTHTVSVRNGAITLESALNEVLRANPKSGEVRLADSGRYENLPAIQLARGQRLALRADPGQHPSLVMDEWSLAGEEESEILLEGLLVIGTIAVDKLISKTPGAATNKLRKLHLRRCTLVPSRILNMMSSSVEQSIPGIICAASGVEIILENCITGSLQIDVASSLSMTNCIIDALQEEEVAYSAPDGQAPGGSLSARNCTFIGRVHAEILHEVTNTIFLSRFASGATWANVQSGQQAPVRSEQRQAGCVRSSFVPWGSRTPRRSACHPATRAEANSLWPRMISLHYGHPAYAQLSNRNPDSIWRGAEDESSIGAYHDLFEPQRLVNLKIRLNEYLRFGLEGGIFLVSA